MEQEKAQRRLSARRRLQTLMALSMGSLALTGVQSVAGADPVCSETVIDWDDDGWGWENNTSCTMPTDTNTNTNTPSNNTNTNTPSNNADPVCSDSVVDWDDDGWGWENNTSCTMPTDTNTNTPSNNTNTNTPSNNADPVCSDSVVDWDNDGWGWENNTSCTMPTDTNTNTPSNNTNTNTPSNNGQVTTLLMMGQSNALALNTDVQLTNGVASGQDASNPNVIVWTNDGKWEQADLCGQVWHEHSSTHRDGYPYRTHPATPDGGCQNSPGFHFAKGIQASQGGTVALIPTANNGQEIADWYNNDQSCSSDPRPSRSTYRQNEKMGEGHSYYVRDKVTNALSQLQNEYSQADDQIDVIGWIQGEANNNDQDYDQKLEYMIDGFRCEGWYDVDENESDTRFVAALIAESDRDPAKSGAEVLNNKIRDVANNNSYVDYYDSSDLDLLPSGSSFNPHFNGSAIRQIGQGMASKYNSSPN